jgi:hypothetical protein
MWTLLYIWTLIYDDDYNDQYVSVGRLSQLHDDTHHISLGHKGWQWLDAQPLVHCFLQQHGLRAVIGTDAAVSACVCIKVDQTCCWLHLRTTIITCACIAQQVWWGRTTADDDRICERSMKDNMVYHPYCGWWQLLADHESYGPYVWTILLRWLR